jgi:hypothetical protein
MGLSRFILQFTTGFFKTRLQVSRVFDYQVSFSSKRALDGDCGETLRKVNQGGRVWEKAGGA